MVDALSFFTRGSSGTGREELKSFIPIVGLQQVWVSGVSAGCLHPVTLFYLVSPTS